MRECLPMTAVPKLKRGSWSGMWALNSSVCRGSIDITDRIGTGDRLVRDIARLAQVLAVRGEEADEIDFHLVAGHVRGLQRQEVQLAAFFEPAAQRVTRVDGVVVELAVGDQRNLDAIAPGDLRFRFRAPAEREVRALGRLGSHDDLADVVGDDIDGLSVRR